MAKVKGKVAGSSENSTKKLRPAITPEARENQAISLAMDLAIQQLQDGTASSQLITEFVRRGSTKARLEQEILEEQKDLMKAKTEALQATKRMESLFDDALKAFRTYSGQGGSEVIDDDY